MVVMMCRLMRMSTVMVMMMVCGVCDQARVRQLIRWESNRVKGIRLLSISMLMLSVMVMMVVRMMMVVMGGFRSLVASL